MEVSEREARLKKLRMRSWRRGMKEMDLILGPYADAHLDGMSPEILDGFEALLDENDQDLYLWVTGAAACPRVLSPMIERISHAAGLREKNSQHRG